ncbi:MAG: carboxypeptidase-like regulatory domain-containing protein [Bacteroidia bacterium]|jgi:hypothetical protein
MKLITPLLLLLFAFQTARAQQDNDLVQFSGMVVTADSLRALPLVSIRIKNTGKGTYTDPGGFFSFVARKGDTILFSYIGAKTAERVIPNNLKSYRYSIIQPLAEDTFYLPETVIRGWPTLEEFNYYFVKAKIPDQAMASARYNTRRSTYDLPMDGSENGRYYFQQQSRNYYYNGQLPPQRLFDPFAWDEFFKAWKRGDYKSK